MNKLWEYKTTEVARADRVEGFPDHLNQMGQQGWELVAVEPFKDVGVNLFYWKRPTREMAQNTDSDFQHSKKNVATLEQHPKSPIESAESLLIKDSVKPVFASIVRYVVREGYMTQMLQEIKGTPSKEAIYQHTIQSDDNEIFNVSMVPDLTDMITKEESGVNWLDTVEHMLVKFPNGSRTDACSGPIIQYWFNEENAKKFENEPLIMSIASFKVRVGCENDFLDTICATPLSQVNIQKAIIQNDERSYHSVSIDLGETKYQNDAQGWNDFEQLKPFLEFSEVNKTKTSSGVVTTWVNPELQ